MSNVVVKEGGVEGVEFFGKIDKNKHGNVGSEVPAWYSTQHIENLENDINTTKNRLERGEVPEAQKPQTMAELAKMKSKLDNINESRPSFSDGQKDAIAKVSTNLGDKIKDAMFTRSDQKLGLVDAHEESRRMADPCIKLNHEEAYLVKKAGGRIDSRGMASRNDCEKAWKFSQRALGENSNTERLRRP